MRTPLSRILLGAALAVLGAAACGYDPNPESGTLQCGPDDTCPQNYTCMNGACWRDGAGGTGGGDAEKFIGTWVSDPLLAKRVRVCTDGTNETLAWDDYLDITTGGPAALRTMYYCDNWNLDVNGGGTATVIRAGQMCSKPDVNDPTIMFTWHGESLTLTTADGTIGTLEMSLPYEYTTTTGSGSCTLHFTGPMTKS